MAPGVMLLGAAFLFPVVKVLGLSLGDQAAHWSISHFRDFLASPAFITILGRTFVAAQLSNNQLHAILGSRRRRDQATDKGSGALSGRELEVLKLLAVGHTNQEIGDRLHLSVKTIETYRLRISEKLGLRGRANLTRYAADIGLIEFSRAGTE